MFSRGSPCLRRSKISSFLDRVAVTPTDEPLHFLYPRWFASVLQQKPYSASRATKGVHDPEKRHYSHALRPRRLSVHATSQRWLSSSRYMSSAGSAQAQLDLKPSSSMSLRNVDPTNVTGDYGQQETHDVRDGGHGLLRGNTPVSDVDKDSKLTTSPPRSEAVLLPSADSSPNSIPIRRLRASRRKPSSSVLLRRGLVPNLSFQEKALRLVRHLSGRDLMKFRYRKHVLRWRRATGKQLPSAHWTDIMVLLESMAQETHVWPKSTKHKVLHVPEETVSLLSGSTDLQENIWYMSIRNGCRIHVLDAAESEGPHRKVVLSGSDLAIELVEKEICRVQERQARGEFDLKKPIAPIIPSVTALQQKGLPVPTIRGVWSGTDAQPVSISFHNLPSPKTLSVRKFAEYVRALVNSRPPRDQQPKYEHRYKVRDTIERLFSREANQKFVSTNALNTALDYLCRNEFLRSARVILSRNEAVASAETYNILLQSAAKRQDQYFFRYILASMSRFHVRPNAQTWLAYIQCLISPTPKAHAMQRMMDLGYLEDRRALEDVIQANVSHMLSEHLDSGQDVHSFIRFLEEEYSRGILSTVLLNLMLDTVVTRKDLNAMKQLVDCFKQRQISINNATLNHVIRYFRDIDKAMSFLFQHVKLPRYPFDESNFETLFLRAFNYGGYNTCRVLWRYACMEGATSGKMRQMVRASLMGHVSGSRESSRLDVWRQSVGKVVVGLEYHQADIKPSPVLQNMVPPRYADNPVLYLLGSQPLGERRKAIARALVNHDVEVGKQLEPVEPLELMLDAALVLDREWRRNEARPSSTIDVLKNAIHIPVQKREGRKRPSGYSLIPT
ncbi:hypothetical protein VTN96DRAFT_661 [Rasamsonia emersonii]